MNYLPNIDRSSFFNQLAFYSLLGSGAYIVLLWSPNVLGWFFSRYTKSMIFIFPWLMLWLALSWQVVANRDHRLEILLMVSIIIFGIGNVFLSDAPSKSVAPMRNFLFTGIFTLWTSMFLLTDPRRRQWFDWFCVGALAVILPVEGIAWLARGNRGSSVFQIFLLNPIPLGTLIILLSTGPVYLIVQKYFRLKPVGWLLVLLGGLLIFFTHKRGTWLALAAMLLVWMLFRGRRLRFLALSVLLAVGLTLAFQGQRLFARLDPKVLNHFTILHRLELYPFAWHIWLNHPVMGIGLRPSNHESYLPDYRQHNNKLSRFPQTVAKLQTLDNMVLTGLVELGTIMPILYLGLITLIIGKYWRKLRSLPESSTLDWYRVLVLLGFAIHSLSYDSLLFPPVNWLFHVQMGIMAGYQASGPASG